MTVTGIGDARLMLQRLQDAGIAVRDPARATLLDVLLARAAEAEGPLGELLLKRFMDHAEQALVRMTAPHAGEPASSRTHASEQSPLSALVDTLDQAGDGSPVLKAVDGLREAWARRDMETRVSVAIRSLSDDCGPLNSRALVTRALQAMEELSPAYLGHFVNYIDTLLWLQAASVQPPRPNAAETGRKPARSRTRGGR